MLRGGSWTAAFSLVLLSLVKAIQARQRGEEQCTTGVYQGSHVVDLCPQNWPGRREGAPPKLWLVLFHAPWCGHCQELQPEYVKLGRQLASTPGVALGAIDCSEPRHQDLCRKFEIVGYPALKALQHGKVVESYNGQRQTEPLKTWLLSVLRRKGGSARCPPGLVQGGEVVPLCEAHFPGSSSKHAWIIAYYFERERSLPDALSQTAIDLGGRVAGEGGASWRAQLKELGRKYNLRLTLPAGAKGSAVGPLAKVGAVCCDCSGIGDLEAGDGPLWPCGGGGNPSNRRPALAWVGRGGQAQQLKELVEPGRKAGAAMASARRLIELGLEALGAYHPPPSWSDEL
eukprot:TRINITY_DN121264_c0_g1_i1.p1 TRINITY_DN121264_c0_g1~~TRINITY_DN121264_c0_g1_i1.p1  ORF type:complete len:343 (-),score=44.74 TRINITY_DN121264_c0_g1_i1:421-1449(-)